jgi:hypothetical protein
VALLDVARSHSAMRFGKGVDHMSESFGGEDLGAFLVLMIPKTWRRLLNLYVSISVCFKTSR